MIRAKFRVNSVEFFGDPTSEATSRRYALSAIYDTSTPENERFTKATPWADLKMSVDNPAARMEVGQVYYVDFTPAEG
jgi:hypothetical protein